MDSLFYIVFGKQYSVIQLFSYSVIKDRLPITDYRKLRYLDDRLHSAHE